MSKKLMPPSPEMQRHQYRQAMIDVAMRRGMTPKAARAFAEQKMQEQAQLKLEQECEKIRKRAERAKEKRASKAKEQAAP
jgi:hypothetical protein